MSALFPVAVLLSIGDLFKAPLVALKLSQLMDALQLTCFVFSNQYKMYSMAKTP